MPGFEIIGKEEHDQINELFQQSGILFRHGFDALRKDIYKVRDFERAFAKKMGVSDALAVSSGTAALKVGLEALGVGPGDEVITQAFTFVATVEAIVEVGAKPIIANIDESLNIDPNDLEHKISANTKAIIVVHMLGIPSDMENVMSIAEKHNIKVIEDTAWGCGGKFNGEFLGTIGHVGTFSFDFAKTITTGEGGMVVARDKRVLESAKAYHDHGHENNPALPRWEDSRSRSGFNYRMTEMQGAVGIAQLKKLDFVIDAHQKHKKSILEGIQHLPITYRKKPQNFVDTADALIFFAKDRAMALRCREKLLNDGFSTKILPEAFTWHFAATWQHIPQLYNDWNTFQQDLAPSRALLERAVSLPITINFDQISIKQIHKSLENVFQ